MRLFSPPVRWLRVAALGARWSGSVTGSAIPRASSVAPITARVEAFPTP